MRAYFFVNMYTAGIHAGIQSLHCLHEMFLDYPDRDNDLWNWAQNHCTTILLNGGYSANLHNIESFLDDEDNPYVWASWHESLDALDGALTCVGIILPHKIYGAASYIRGNKAHAEEFIERGRVTLTDDLGDEIDYVYSDFELDLVVKVSQHGLAS